MSNFVEYELTAEDSQNADVDGFYIHKGAAFQDYIAQRGGAVHWQLEGYLSSRAQALI